MNTLVKTLSFFITLCMLFFSFCTNKGTESENKITFDTITTNRVYHLNNDSTRPSCSVKIKYIYPITFSDTTVLARIQEKINTLFFEDERHTPLYASLRAKDAAEKYIADYIESYVKEQSRTQSSDDESVEAEGYFSFYKTINSAVLFNKVNLISYQITSMDYKAGNNSLTTYRNFVIDLHSGTILSEEDIFVEDYKQKLNRLLIEKIASQNKVEKASELIPLGYWNIEELTSNNNFTVDEKGITYIINAVEIAMPSIGETRIFFSYNEIADILKENTPLSPLLGK